MPICHGLLIKTCKLNALMADNQKKTEQSARNRMYYFINTTKKQHIVLTKLLILF